MATDTCSEVIRKLCVVIDWRRVTGRRTRWTDRQQEVRETNGEKLPGELETLYLSGKVIPFWYVCTVDLFMHNTGIVHEPAIRLQGARGPNLR